MTSPRPTASSFPTSPLDPGLLHRLSQRARRALYTANVIRERLADPVLSTVHLVAGLYETFGSGLEPLLNRAGIGADRLREILRSTGHREILFDETYLNADLDALPSCSRNVRFALATATQAAAEEDARDVECRHLLLGLLSARGSAVVSALLDHGVQPPERPRPPRRRLAIPGYRPDALTGEDLLGIGNDVEALASLLAARDVALPLSIGLFGEWGSGKSFFMQQMRTRIDALVTDAATDAGQVNRRRTAGTSSSSNSTPGTTSTPASGPAWPRRSSRGWPRRSTWLPSVPGEWQTTGGRRTAECLGPAATSPRPRRR